MGAAWAKTEVMRVRGYWRDSDSVSVTAEEAYVSWAGHAYDILIGVARSYHAVIEYGALAEEAQAVSGVHTSVPFATGSGGFRSCW